MKYLCYVEGNFAYFTSNLEKQWGDDWDNVPYEHNSGLPYEYSEGTPHIETEIDVIAFKSEMETPGELANSNSKYSVQDINNKKIPWLSDRFPYVGERKPIISIFAGVTKDEFIEKINKTGGDIFLPISELNHNEE